METLMGISVKVIAAIMVLALIFECRKAAFECCANTFIVKGSWEQQ